MCVTAEEEVSDEALVEIASEYGADIVDENGSVAMVAKAEDEGFATYPIYGVIGGIVGNENENVSEEAVARNVFAIFQYLESTFSDEDRPSTDDSELTDGDHDEQA